MTEHRRYRINANRFRALALWPWRAWVRGKPQPAGHEVDDEAA